MSLDIIDHCNLDPVIYFDVRENFPPQPHWYWRFATAYQDWEKKVLEWLRGHGVTTEETYRVEVYRIEGEVKLRICQYDKNARGQYYLVCSPDCRHDLKADPHLDECEPATKAPFVISGSMPPVPPTEWLAFWLKERI